MLELFTQKASIGDNDFLDGYIAQEKYRLLSYLKSAVTGKSYTVGKQLSGVDFMLSFNLIMFVQRQQLEGYSHIKQYADKLAALDIISALGVLRLNVMSQDKHKYIL